MCKIPHYKVCTSIHTNFAPHQKEEQWLYVLTEDLPIPLIHTDKIGKDGKKSIIGLTPQKLLVF
jgi:hypothetical protein